MSKTIKPKNEVKQKLSQIHKGHRERLRKKVRLNAQVCETHELIELIIFGTTPYKNTNIVAHDVMRYTNDLKSFTPEVLSTLPYIKNMTCNSQIVLTAIAELMNRRDNAKTVVPDNMPVDRIVSEYLPGYYRNKSNEELLMVCLDSNNRFKKEYCISKGTRNSVTVETDEIVKCLFASDTRRFILAHNHPDGVCEPSLNDYYYTKDLCKRMHTLKFNMLEHYIVAGNRLGGIMGMTYESLQRVGLPPRTFEEVAINDLDKNYGDDFYDSYSKLYAKIKAEASPKKS